MRKSKKVARRVTKSAKTSLFGTRVVAAEAGVSWLREQVERHEGLVQRVERLEAIERLTRTPRAFRVSSGAPMPSVRLRMAGGEEITLPGTAEERDYVCGPWGCWTFLDGVWEFSELRAEGSVSVAATHLAAVSGLSASEIENGHRFTAGFDECVRVAGDESDREPEVLTPEDAECDAQGWLRGTWGARVEPVVGDRVRVAVSFAPEVVKDGTITCDAGPSHVYRYAVNGDEGECYYRREEIEVLPRSGGAS